MRTLIVYGREESLRRAVALRMPDIHTSPSSVRIAVVPGIYTMQNVKDPGDVVQGIVVGDPRDLDKLRGIRYDIVIEDHSFELYAPSWTDAQAWSAHSDPSMDLYSRWREFLQAYVLSRA